MPELFDPAEFVVYPGTGGSVATTRSTLSPCKCGCSRFETVVESRKHPEGGPPIERVSNRCPECFRNRRPLRVLGWIDMLTGQTTEAPK